MDKMINNKKGQEEMVGFMVIVVIVSIILLFFLVLSLTSKNQGVESYRAESFLQSMLAYTTTCEEGFDFMPMDELIASCYNEERCKNEEYSCDVLNQTLMDLIDKSWPVGPDFKYKGYKIEAISGEETVFSISKGNATGSYELGNQILSVSGAQIRLAFTAYK